MCIMDENQETPRSVPAYSSCSELQELLPAYVIGALNEEELVRIHVLFEECPEATGELKDYAALMIGFLERIEPVQPPESVLGEILNAVQETQPSRIPEPIDPPLTSTTEDNQPPRPAGTR